MAPRTSGIERAIQILNFLSRSGEPSTGYAIAKAIGASPSTIYPIVAELVQNSLLLEIDNSIWLGPQVLVYGRAYAGSVDILRAAATVIRRMRDEAGECVQLCAREDGAMVVLAMEEGRGHFRVTSRVGSSIPLNWTASGRLLLGHLPFEERLELFQRYAKPSPTGRAPIDPTKLATVAGEAFAKGISVQVNESDFAVACAAAPIRDDQGRCLATVSIVLPEQRLAEDYELIAAILRRGAQDIEGALGTTIVSAAG
jgi:DNA-binding IclR family transcriptional regulator